MALRWGESAPNLTRARLARSV